MRRLKILVVGVRCRQLMDREKRLRLDNNPENRGAVTFEGNRERGF